MMQQLVYVAGRVPRSQYYRISKQVVTPINRHSFNFTKINQYIGNFLVKMNFTAGI
ncbi:hypothetical protein D3C87_2180230 [compost metagenome]